jgi:polyisoprenoid-binding protein YceI
VTVDQALAVSHRADRPNVSGGHRWLRRIIIGSATLIVVLTAGTFIGLHFMVAAAPAPLRLPALSASQQPASGPPADGIWTVRSGSIAGFRSQMSLLGQGGTIAGRSTALSGTIDVVRGDVSSASFTIGLTGIEIYGKANAGFSQMADTAKYPAATFILAKPVLMSADPLLNTTYRAMVSGSLTMHGITRPVTFTITARNTGSSLEAAGSIPVTFSAWNLKTPFGIEPEGVIEFVLQMDR